MVLTTQLDALALYSGYLDLSLTDFFLGLREVSSFRRILLLKTHMNSVPHGEWVLFCLGRLMKIVILMQNILNC